VPPIAVHDEISEKSIVLVIKGTKMTAQLLAKAMNNLLDKLTEPEDMSGKGKQTVKQLTRQGVGVSSIEITDKNIKAFEGIARKYGVDFALKKDVGETPPRWLVFFKGRDTDVLTAAFKEFSAKQLSKSAEKPSVLKALSNLLEQVKNQVVDRTKNMNKGREL
jgi:hypothetical protein